MYGVKTYISLSPRCNISHRIVCILRSNCSSGNAVANLYLASDLTP